MPITTPRHRQEQEFAFIEEGDLGTGQHLEPEVPRAHMSTHQPVHTIAVGERHGTKAEPLCFLHQFVGVTGALEEGVVALHP